MKLIRPRTLFVSAACALALTAASSIAWAQGAPVATASEEQVSAATDAYLAGKAAFDNQSFDEALAKFQESYDIVASPNAQLMVIATKAELGRAAEAYGDIEPALSLARDEASRDPKYQATVESLEQLQSDLSAKVGMVSVAVPPDATGATLTVNGRMVPPGAWSRPIAVDPGPVSVDLTGYPSQSGSVEAGGTTSLSFDAPAPATTDEDGDAHGAGHVFKENRRILAYSLGGVGGVGMVLFGVFGGLTLSAEGSLDDACDPATLRCPVDSQGDIDDGKTFQTVANVGLVIGIVGLAAGGGLLVWDLLDDDDDGGGDFDTDGDDLATLKLHAGPTYLGLEGTF